MDRPVRAADYPGDRDARVPLPLIRREPPRPKGAILLTAALPAVYLVLSGAFAEATTLLLLGIGLGIVRERTGSIAPGLLASAAMIAVEYSLRG